MGHMRRIFPENMVLSFILNGFIAEIFRAYFDLKTSFRNQLNNSVSEPRLLAYSFLISLVLFLERLPERLSNYDVQPSKGLLFDYVGVDLFASMFFGPIFLYCLSSLAHILALPFKGKASFFEARLAFFWSIVVASPLLLISGLLNGFFPNGLLFKFVQFSSMIVYAWIFSSIFCAAESFVSHLPLFFILLFGHIFFSYLVIL